MPYGKGTYGKTRGRPPSKGLRRPRRSSPTGLRGPRKRKPKLR
mgnify:CR=1 FL=1